MLFPFCKVCEAFEDVMFELSMVKYLRFVHPKSGGEGGFGLEVEMS